MGSLQTALLYSCYTLTALFGANLIISVTGVKGGIVCGLALYVGYVGSFILADYASSVKWPAACIGIYPLPA